jgi:AAA15 family ATPase/GTPase
MPHLYKIGLENFRVFKDYTEIEFAPITVLTGANNSGKSSVIKAIQLLKSNFSDPRPNSDLILSFISGDHKLSSFNDVVNDPSKPLTFILPLVLRGIDENLSIAFTYKKNEKNELGEGIISSIELFSENGKPVFQYKMDESKPKTSTDFNYFYKKLLKLIDYLESYQKEYDSKEDDYNNSEEKKDAYTEHPFYNLSNDNIIKIRDAKRKIGFYPYPVIDNYGPVTFLGGKSNDQKTIEPKFDKTGLINPLYLLLYLIREGKIKMSIWAEQYSISFHKAKENQKETVIYSPQNRK